MPGFYRPPPELLSQGDIIEKVPWGLIEAPITLCRPDNNILQGKSRHSTADPWHMPGAPKPWARAGNPPERIHAIGWDGRAMVLWHDCQISKAENQDRNRPEKEFAGVAPILPLSKLQAKNSEDLAILQAGIRNGANHSYFFLPAVETDALSLPDSYVNFRYVWSIRQSALTRRPLSLEVDQLMSLYGSLFTFLTRFRLDVDPRCPSCNTRVPLHVTPAPLADDDD